MSAIPQPAANRHQEAFEDTRVFMIGAAERHALTTQEVEAIMARMVGKLCRGNEPLLQVAVTNLLEGSRE